MFKKLDNHSISITKNLEEPFDYSIETITKIITDGHSILLKDNEFLKEIKSYYKLHKFLGKKRNPPNLILDEIDEIKKDLKNIEPEKISISENKEIFNIEIKGKNKNYALINIFKNPFLVYKISDNVNRIDIDLITETNTYLDNIGNLSEYDFNLYYIINKELKVLKYYDGLEIMKIDNIIIPEEKIGILNKEKENFLKINPFLLVIKSLIPKINEEDLKYENIYHEIDCNSKDIKPINITKKYFYYFTVDKDSQNKYVFILTDERKKFIDFLRNFITFEVNKNIIIIGGPKGVGKSSSLIFFSFLKNIRVFYANLEALNRNNNELKEKDLLIELTKLYGNCEIIDEGKSKNEIENYIKTNCQKTSILEIITNIIIKFIPFVNEVGYNFCFIIDQVSFRNDNNNIDKLYEIINKVKECKYLKLIICTTLNNDYSKNTMNNIFNYKLPFNENNNGLYDFYYFQTFISKNDIYENILKNENENIINVMSELGDLPEHFYEIKKNNNIKNYLQYIENDINENIKNYFGETKISNILEILDLVYGEKIISSYLLKERIKKIPLKYLIIKKFKINKDLIEKYNKIHKDDKFLKYLDLLTYNLYNKEYDKIFEKYYDFLEIESNHYINEYLEKDQNSRNIFGDFYGDFIKKNEINLCTTQYEIYVYKIEFSMNLFQKILFNKIHEYLQKEYQIFIDIFSKGVIGGLFEIIVNFAFIKNDFELFNIKIDEITQIDRIVPSNFSINNYSSKRNKIKFKVYKRVNERKKKLEPNKNVYVFQRIFTSKYYDSAILLKTNNNNEYDLLVIQTTIKKDKNKRLDKYEHEIIISYVKEHLEYIFDIKIRKSYFFYVLSENDGIIDDLETKNDCENTGIKYLTYDIKNKKFNANFKLEGAFITNNFLIHNCVSIFNFKELKENNIVSYELIKKLDFSGFCEINQEIFNLMKIFFKNKESPNELIKEQFKYKNYTEQLNDIKKIKISLTYFGVYLLKKMNKYGEKIYFKFMDKYYKYEHEKYENLKIKLDNINEIYIIYSIYPLTLNN